MLPPNTYYKLLFTRSLPSLFSSNAATKKRRSTSSAFPRGARTRRPAGQKKQQQQQHLVVLELARRVPQVVGPRLDEDARAQNQAHGVEQRRRAAPLDVSPAVVDDKLVPHFSGKEMRGDLEESRGVRQLDGGGREWRRAIADTLFGEE